MFTAGEWPSHHSQRWSDLAKTLKQSGVNIFAYGVRPGAQREQLQSITFNPGDSELLDDYILPRPIPTGVTGEDRTCLMNNNSLYHRGYFYHQISPE